MIFYQIYFHPHDDHSHDDHSRENIGNFQKPAHSADTSIKLQPIAEFKMNVIVFIFVNICLFDMRSVFWRFEAKSQLQFQLMETQCRGEELFSVISQDNLLW